MLKTITKELLQLRSNKFLKLQPLSTAPQVLKDERLQSFRTNEADPQKHNDSHLAQYYKLASDEKKIIFGLGGLPKSFETQTKTFNESCLMIRTPSVDVINCLKNVDYSRPPVKFCLFGKKGSGKSLSLAHILHYGYKAGFLLMHIPWVGSWMRRCKEFSNSEKREGFVDINLDAAAWLIHFKTQNAHLLSNPEFLVSNDYVWSKRETTAKGSHINELIELGINRVKYASETIIALSEEIKNLSNTGKCKTLVAIDGYNAFFYPNTRVYTEKKEVVHPHKVTPTLGFLNLSKFDWKNSAIVVTVDEIAIAEKDQISYLPRYLLGKDGFEHLDPFVPILVPGFSEKEFLSCMDYYRERKWVQPYKGQDEELSFLSNNNPFKLMELCAPL